MEGMNRGDEDMGAGNRWSGSYSRVSLATLTILSSPVRTGRSPGPFGPPPDGGEDG